MANGFTYVTSVALTTYPPPSLAPSLPLFSERGRLQGQKKDPVVSTISGPRYIPRNFIILAYVCAGPDLRGEGVLTIPEGGIVLERLKTTFYSIEFFRGGVGCPFCVLWEGTARLRKGCAHVCIRFNVNTDQRSGMTSRGRGGEGVACVSTR